MDEIDVLMKREWCYAVQDTLYLDDGQTWIKTFGPTESDVQHCLDVLKVNDLCLGIETEETQVLWAMVVTPNASGIRLLLLHAPSSHVDLDMKKLLEVDVKVLPSDMTIANHLEKALSDSLSSQGVKAKVTIDNQMKHGDVFMFANIEMGMDILERGCAVVDGKRWVNDYVRETRRLGFEAAVMKVMQNRTEWSTVTCYMKVTLPVRPQDVGQAKTREAPDRKATDQNAILSSTSDEDAMKTSTPQQSDESQGRKWSSLFKAAAIGLVPAFLVYCKQLAEAV